MAYKPSSPTVTQLLQTNEEKRTDHLQLQKYIRTLTTSSNTFVNIAHDHPGINVDVLVTAANAVLEQAGQKRTLNMK